MPEGSAMDGASLTSLYDIIIPSVLQCCAVGTDVVISHLNICGVITGV